MSKPLFVPLKAEFYDAFVAGTKTDELRAYGPRWNERTCTIGRAVTLSCGYGKARRLNRRIVSFQVIRRLDLPEPQRSTLARLYGTDDFKVACITLAKDAQP